MKGSSPAVRAYALYARLAYASWVIFGLKMVSQTPCLRLLPGEIARLSKVFVTYERIYPTPFLGLGHVSKEISLVNQKLTNRANAGTFPDDYSSDWDTV